MKKFIPLVICITLVGIGCEKYGIGEKEEHKVVKHGVVVVDGKAEYIDPGKVYSSMERTDKDILKFIQRKAKIIPAYEIEFYRIDKEVGVYNAKLIAEQKYNSVLEGRMIFKYKLKNNSLYLYKDGERDRLSVTITRDDPYVKNNLEYYMHVYLKCKWFEGEYAITAEHLKHKKGDL